MPTSIPKSVRDAWGEEATEAFARWFEQAVQEAAVPRDEYREVLSRLDLIEHDLGGIKERLDRIDARFEQIGDRFNQVDVRFDQMHAQFNDRFDRLHEQTRATTRWTAGTIALFGTLITVLLAIAEFTS